jgi:glutamine---fructose-6-phosphate transaminase (isomerizing)
MCGIFGYVGVRQAAPIILNGLETLEYRGYDSAGVYLADADSVTGITYKAVGPVSQLRTKVGEGGPACSGIGHTRWATHGPPSERNAHPHFDGTERIAVVHNGIVENFQSLKEGLIAQGMTFSSDTDTEVLAKLIGSVYRGNLQQAVIAALALVRGTYGIAVMSGRETGEIVVARLGSPIVVGIGNNEHYVASDPSALLPHTKDVVYLNDGDVAVVTQTGYTIVTHDGVIQERLAERIEWEAETLQKQGYRHFMEKEIFEGSTVIENTLRGRLLEERGRAKLGGLESKLDALANIKRLVIVGCGSAYYAGCVGRSMIEEYAGIPVEVEIGSEFRYKKHFWDTHTALLAISQSGETADTLAAVRAAKEAGILTVGIVNVVGSTIARETDVGVYNHAGPEVAVASTKAFISQLTVLALLTLFLGRERNLSLAEGQAIAAALADLPEALGRTLALAPHLEELAKKYAKAKDVMYIGRGAHAPIAYEGALKLKEVTYVHAEAYAGGELKHGSIALLEPVVPVVALVPHDAVYEKMVSNIQEVRARHSPVIAITSGEGKELAGLVSDVITIPQTHPLLQPILSTVPLQLFAYYVGLAKGLNVDRPRNLAKSVTVE